MPQILDCRRLAEGLAGAREPRVRLLRDPGFSFGRSISVEYVVRQNAEAQRGKHRYIHVKHENL